MARRMIVASPEVGGTVFPEEIMMEIIARLEVKPLMHFKKVNRGWKNLIESRYFIIKKHLEAMKRVNNVGYVLQMQYGFYPLGYDRTPPGVPMTRSLMDGDPDIDFLCSCNGLVVYCNIGDEFFIWNPVTDKNAVIPSTPIDFESSCLGASVFSGLGYVPEGDEYKLLRVAVFSSPRFVTEVKILSFRNMEWRRVGDFPYEYPVANPGVFAGGCLNFVVTQPDGLLGIATFSMSQEVYGLIELPPGLDSVQFYGELGALDEDRICLYSSMCMAFNGFEMWVLEEHMRPETWRRIWFNPHCPVVYNDRVISPQPLRLLKPGNDKLLMRVEPVGVILIYDLVTGAYLIIDGPMLTEEYFTIFPYVQSVEVPRMLVG